MQSSCPHSKFLSCSSCYNKEQQLKLRRSSITNRYNRLPGEDADDANAGGKTSGNRRASLPHQLLQVPELEERDTFERQRNFVIDKKKGLVDRGDSFRPRAHTIGTDSPHHRRWRQSPRRSATISERDEESVAPPPRCTILVVGAEGSGKTSLINQFMSHEASRNSFIVTEDSEPEYEQVAVSVQGKQYEVTFIEGHYSADNLSWMSNIPIADGFIVVYAVERRNSFSDAQRILHILNAEAPEKPSILAGNKCDLARRQSVQIEEGRKLADRFDKCKFTETSSVLNYNTDLLLVGILEQIYEIIDPATVGRCGSPAVKSLLQPGPDSHRHHADSAESGGIREMSPVCKSISALGHRLMDKLKLSTSQ